jgi:hypothetical protein
MRVYLELIETPPEGSTEEADFIRIDITDWNKNDVDSAISLLREHAKIYSNYIIQLHYCYHDEEPTKSCNVIIIE